MKEIPVPKCTNNHRTTIKCRRMCCRKVKPKSPKKGVQTIWFGSGQRFGIDPFDETCRNG